jgi:hypothetical protein
VFDGDDPHPRARLASAVMAATYVIVVATWDDVGDAVRMFGYCMMPLACIWFPAAMGDYTGSMTLRRSPAVFVFVLGWIVLLLPGVVFVIFSLVYGW